MSPAPFLTTMLDRVKAIVRRVVRRAAERARPMSVDAPASAVRRDGVPRVPARSAEAWMSARVLALAALMRRIEAGELPVHAPRVAEGRNLGDESDAFVPPQGGPRGFGWMCGLGPNVRRDGEAFAALLNETWVQAMVLAAPREMAQAILPILHAVGERVPAWFPVVPPSADVVATDREGPGWTLDGAGCSSGVAAADFCFQRHFRKPARRVTSPLDAPTRRGRSSRSERAALPRHAVRLRGAARCNGSHTPHGPDAIRDGPRSAILKTSDWNGRLSYALIVTISQHKAT